MHVKDKFKLKHDNLRFHAFSAHQPNHITRLCKILFNSFSDLHLYKQMAYTRKEMKRMVHFIYLQYPVII